MDEKQSDMVVITCKWPADPRYERRFFSGPYRKFRINIGWMVYRVQEARPAPVNKSRLSHSLNQKLKLLLFTVMGRDFIFHSEKSHAFFHLLSAIKFSTVITLCEECKLAKKYLVINYLIN